MIHQRMRRRQNRLDEQIKIKETLEMIDRERKTGADLQTRGDLEEFGAPFLLRLCAGCDGSTLTVRGCVRSRGVEGEETGDIPDFPARRRSKKGTPLSHALSLSRYH